MGDPRFLAILGLLLVLALVVRRYGPPQGQAHQAPWLVWGVPVLAAVVTAGLTAWVWGGADAPAVLHDESAYLFQSALLARGKWSLPAPAVPEAFAQPAVLVTPVLTAKMPPGHAMMIAPGHWLGLPGLVPILLAGFTAALLVLLARRIAGQATALLTLALWLTQAGQWRWRASYLSETTTAMLWLLGWYALLRWMESKRTGWLLTLAAAAGWGALTRPLTMLAFAAPIGVVVLRDALRSKRWKPVFGAIAVGAVWLLILPLQNRETLGRWSSSPLSLYTKQYLPFDRLGFGYDSTAPALGLPADLAPAMEEFAQLHREHTVGSAPRTLVERLGVLVNQLTSRWRMLWLPALVVGLILVPPAGRFALGTLLLLYLSYLLYAHESYWTAYYYEATPVAALVIAVGLSWLFSRLAGGEIRDPVAAVLALGILAAGSQEIGSAHQIRINEQRPIRAFDELLRRTTAAPSLILVRPDPGSDPHLSLIRNDPNPNAARLIARDLGEPGNQRLATAYPDRTVYLWDQKTNRVTPRAIPAKDPIP